jgi:hypothetical protein
MRAHLEELLTQVDIQRKKYSFYRSRWNVRSISFYLFSAMMEAGKLLWMSFNESARNLVT